jgi:hypothetical protein
LNFVDLPDDIHVEIARIIDPKLCMNYSSFPRADPILSDEVYKDIQPSETLARLTLVCKRLRHIYAPLSTWRNLFIEADSPHSSQLLGDQSEPSPSLTRVLKHPETGSHARELLIRFGEYQGWSEGFYDALDRFLSNTPRLETVRFIGPSSGGAGFPIQFLPLLSSLASLRYGIRGSSFISAPAPSPHSPVHPITITHSP